MSMPTSPRAAHLSLYAVLAAAVWCLGMAELFFLPRIPWLMAALAAGFLFAWRREGGRQLSESAANALGLVIACAMVAWMVWELPRDEDSVQRIPWPAGLLPFLGPLLMVLATAKLLRPKTDADYWILQALGVMIVTLASVLAGEFHHAIWLFVYVAMLHWSLAARQGEGTGDCNARGFGRSLASSTLAGAVGLGLFLVTPRAESTQWQPFKLAATRKAALSGGDMSFDLNHVGNVELSEEPAFRVMFRDADDRMVNPPENGYWRTDVLDHYADGRWRSLCQEADLWPNDGRSSPRITILSPPGLDPPDPSRRPENAPPDCVYASFRLAPGMGASVVFAEPADPDRGLGINPYFGRRPSRSNVVGYFDGGDTLLPMPLHRRTGLAYGQYWDPDVNPLRRRANRVSGDYRTQFLLQPPPAPMVTWARAFLYRTRGMTEEQRTLDAEGRVDPRHHAAVASALARQFAESGEYLYSLKLRRVDPALEPNLDFVQNVKQGHCERYASALTLTLRGLGIPCRIVNGYRGSEREDEGSHIVRCRHAHAWVEVLALDPATGDRVWILVDPTPSIEAPLTQIDLLTQWVRDRVRDTRDTFREALLEFGSSQQSRLSSALQEALLTWGWAIILAVAFVVGRRYVRFGGWAFRASGPGLRAGWLRRFEALASRHAGLTHRPEQTWHEFVSSAMQAWRTRVPSEILAQLPALADCHDQIRFASRPATPAQLRAIHATLACLGEALAGRPAPR